VKSMTGYGEAAWQGRRVKIGAQIRSLNHRSLDIQLRLPREYLALDDEIRRKIRDKIGRGRVEVFLTRSAPQGSSRRIELDEELVAHFVKALRILQRKYGLKGQLDLSLLGSRPELFRIQEGEGEPRGEKSAVLRVVGAALRNLEQSRRREGRNLRRDMQLQVRSLRVVCSHLDREAALISARVKDLLLSPQAGNGLEKAAVAEANLKGDIHEEVVRLQSHLLELARTLRSLEPAGKRLEFLLQEVQRELNTIGAKAPQLAVSRWILEGKERVEKIREQAQNVE
jgi:uncharacterized protein (TIGR00255 family)